MGHADFLCLVLCLTSTLVLSQSEPATLSQFKSAGTVSDPSLTVVSAPANPKAPNKILDGYGKLPLSFEANHGQADKRVKFLSRTSGYTLFLTGDEAVLALGGDKVDTKTMLSASAHPPQSGIVRPKADRVLRMKLHNANPGAKVTGTDELAGTSNYFIGNDPSKWRKNVPTYAKVKYEGIYSGIDLVYYGNQRQLEYDFVVAPGADPRRIVFDVRGEKRIRRTADGDLLFEMGAGDIRWHKPVAYQEKDGRREELKAEYAVTNPNRVGFVVSDADPSRPIYIDPLVYSTYLGGSGTDEGHAITVDASGSAYVAGWTSSTDFPTFNPLQAHNAGSYDAFVAKLDASGSALIYSAYFGGSDNDGITGVAVDNLGDVYVAGWTVSSNFPTKNPLQAVKAGGSTNGFVAKLDPSGSALVYSTYLGGSGAGGASGIVLDRTGNAYVTGSTSSLDFPTAHPLQPANGGGNDAFVAKLNASGSALIYSTYIGGGGDDVGTGIALDNAGNAYITGQTASPNFPTINPLQSAYGGGNDDGFVAKINVTGSALVYSTYLGGSGADGGIGIAVDNSGNAYVTGYTASSDFPTKNPLQTANGGGLYDAFVTEINSSGSALIYSTYLGGNGYDQGSGIAVDSSGDALVTGYTSSTNFPTVNPLQTGNAGDYDAFVAKLNTAGQLSFIRPVSAAVVATTACKSP